MFKICKYLLASALLVSCSSKDTEGALFKIPVKSTQEFDVSHLSERLKATSKEQDRGTSWAIMQMLTELAPDAHTRAVEVSILDQHHTSDVAFFASVIFDRVPEDDSVSSYRYDLTIVRADSGGGLRVKEGRASWRCWSGRGHQNFSVKACS